MLNIPNCHVCPYHYLKHVVNKADIVLSPYNFILDPDVQKSIGLDLKNRIIAFDEAHNLETIAEDVYSSELEVSDLLNTIELKPGNKIFKAYLRKLSS